MIYESLQNSNLNKTPGLNPTWWQDRGATNRFAMFDNVIGTSTTATTSLTVVYAPNSIFNSISLINLGAAVAKITIRDGSGGPIVYENIAGVAGSQSYSWSDYFFNDPLLKRTQIVFSDIPPYLNAHITLELTSSVGSLVSLAQLLVGDLVTLGKTEYGASAGIVDYSVKQTDEFGTTTFVKRAFSKRLNASFNIENSDLNRVQSYLYTLRATPAVWIASDEVRFEETLIVYGFYKDFSTEISYPTFSKCNIEIESLT